MRQVWDNLWSRRESSSIDDIVLYDDCYQLLKRLIAMPQAHNLSILEVGGGSGIYTFSAVKEIFEHISCRIILVDFSPAALAIAHKNARNNKVTAVNLVLADALKLPFADGIFDFVWNEGVNEHFDGEQRQLIFNEMARVCKPRGQVIVIVPNALNPAYRLRKKILEIQRKWEYGFELPYSFFELRRRMRNAGLVPMNSGGCGILASVALLRQALVLRKDVRKQSHCCKKREYFKKALRKINVGVDTIFFPVSVFLGAYIGIKAIKPVRGEDR